MALRRYVWPGFLAAEPEAAQREVDALSFAGAHGVPVPRLVAADTDGTDGGQGRPDDPAGAFIDDTTLARAKGLGLDPAAFLADNDSTGFFNGIDDLFTPGPTFTNVTDFRAIVVDRPAD